MPRAGIPDQPTRRLVIRWVDVSDGEQEIGIKAVVAGSHADGEVRLPAGPRRNRACRAVPEAGLDPGVRRTGGTEGAEGRRVAG